MNDLRYYPSYNIAQAARYLEIKPTTLRSWFIGRTYKTNSGIKNFEPPLELTDPSSQYISFINLVEAYVLNTIRKTTKRPLREVKEAIAYLQKEYPGKKFLLAYHELYFDGVGIYAMIDQLLTSLNEHGQIHDKEIVKRYLKRINFDTDGYANQLFPVTLDKNIEKEKLIVIDPYISFGNPVLLNLGVKVEIIAERIRQGASIDYLARDYGAKKEEIEVAISWFNQHSTAA